MVSCRLVMILSTFVGGFLCYCAVRVQISATDLFNNLFPLFNKLYKIGTCGYEFPQSVILFTKLGDCGCSQIHSFLYPFLCL